MAAIGVNATHGKDEVEHCAAEEVAELRTNNLTNMLMKGDVDLRQEQSKETGANSLSTSQHHRTHKHIIPDRTIFVGNISFLAWQKDLLDIFQRFGKVQRVYIVKHHITKKSKGYAFVKFHSEDAAQAAMNCGEEIELQGRVLRITIAEQSKRSDYKNYSHKPLQSVELQDNMKDLQVQDSECDESEQVSVDDQTSSGHVSCDEIGWMNQLPDIVMLRVFQLLPMKDRIKCERVSSHWRNLSRSSWFGLHILEFSNMFSDFHSLTDNILQCVLEKGCSNLTHIDLTRSMQTLTEKAVEMIAHHCPRLTNLDISRVPATNQSLRVLGSKCKKIKVFKMKSSHNIGEKGFWWLFHQCQDLEVIDIEGNTKATGQCFHMLGPSVKSMNLTGCQMVKSAGMKQLLTKCPNIEELHLSKMVKLCDLSLSYLVQHCTKLKVLELAECFETFSVDGLKMLAKIKTLEHLNLSMSKTLINTALEVIGEGCSKLSYLNISCTLVGEGSPQCLDKFMSLTHLDISYLAQVNDGTLISVALNHILQSLIARGCSGFTDHALINLAQHCSNMTEVDISGCLQITTGTLRAFCNNENRDTKQKLELRIGGTSIQPDEVVVPEFVTVSDIDLCRYYLRTDQGILFNSGYDSDVDDYDEFFGNDEEDFNGLWMDGYRFDDFLDGYSPCTDEDFDWS